MADLSVIKIIPDCVADIYVKFKNVTSKYNSECYLTHSLFWKNYFVDKFYNFIHKFLFLYGILLKFYSRSEQND